MNQDVNHLASKGKESLRSQGASAEAIQYHYDIGNEFYRLWLDPSALSILIL